MTTRTQHHLPGPVARVWPHAGSGRAVTLRWPANACRRLPARTWTMATQRRSATTRAAACMLFTVVLVTAASGAVVAVAALLPLRLLGLAGGRLLQANGWRPPRTPAQHLVAANRVQAQHLAEIRNGLPQAASLAEPAALPAPSSSATAEAFNGPTGQLPPWADRPHRPPAAATWPEPSPQPIYTAPHYVRVPPPAGAVMRSAVAARGPISTAWLAFKVLALVGFVYALALGCLITVAADRLSPTPTTNTEATP